MIQALFFDAAGTLFRPAKPVSNTYARLLSPHLGSLDPARLESAFSRAFRQAGLPAYQDQQNGDLAERAWWRKVVEETVGQRVSDDAFRAVFDFYADGPAWQLFPEVVPALQRAKDAGLRCAVVSNFDLRLHRVLHQLGLAPFFDLVLSSAEACARKPSPHIFNHALRLLDLGPNEVLHVGDSAKADIDGAAAAGIEAFLLERPENDLEQFIDWVSHRPGN